MGVVSSLTQAISIKVIDDATKPARSVADGLKAAERAARDAAKAFANTGATDRFTASLAKLSLSRQDIATVSKAWKDYSASAKLAGNAAQWTRQQAADVKRWESQTVASIRSVQREQARMRRAPGAINQSGGVRGAIGAGVGVMTAHHARTFARSAIESAADFDIAVRQQKVFMDLTPQIQEALKTQAMKIGQDTKFTNLDVVHAQTAAMQGMGARMTPGQKAQAAHGMVAASANFAQMMPGTDLTQASELLRAYLLSFGKDLTDPVKAVTESVRAANIMLKTAKAGGMSTEDLEQYIKFAGAGAKAAGITEETAMAISAVARRGNLRGDEAGVFVRSMSNKLVNPTKQGITALAAAGIDYNQFRRMPDQLSVGGFEAHMQRGLGKKLDARAREKLSGILSNKQILGDQETFTSAVTGAIGHLFTPKKDGKMRASDSARIAREVGKFYKVSAESVDTMGLLNTIFGGKMTFAQASAFFTDKHGGKAMITQDQFGEMQAIIKILQDIQKDPKFAERGAAEIQGGVGGEVNRFKGSVETFILKMGEANEGLIKFAASLGGGALDAVSGASGEVRQLATAAGAAAAVFSGFKTVEFVKSLLGGGSSSALTASAGALSTSAGLLDAAAVKLAGGTLPGVLPGDGKPGGAKPGVGKPSAFGGGFAGALLGYLVYEGGKAGIDAILGRLPKPAYPNGYDPTAKMDVSLWQRFADMAPHMRRVSDYIAATNPNGSSAPEDIRRGSSMRQDRIWMPPGSGGGSGGSLPTFARIGGTAPGLTQLGAQVDQTKEKLNEIGNTTVSPKVDSSSIDGALSKVKALKSELAGVSADIAGVSSRIPQLGRTMRGHFGVGGGQGEGG